ncbi:hypothetical protein BRARA_F02519 [Brassica rapa]|uniref:Non-specific serine/threonine protein kinase n=1 Tax=Brassica campestris TaxID=3711 RepID=A0A397Z2Z4_BRACM|nr:hypothetical protein BRARA_F02519 [Brassica rapa]
MSPIQNFEQHSRRLVDPDLPIQTRLEMVVEVRDSLEIAHTAEYLNFMKCYFPAFSVILLQITKPQFVDNPEHKLRNIVVEILNRLPHSEVLRPFVQDLLKVAMQVLTTDNEENGLICIRIIFDLLRNFRPTLENEVQPFLDFVCKIYQVFRFTVSHFFDNVKVEEVKVKPVETSASSDQSSLTPVAPVGNGQLNPSTRSFKIITESPLVVMFLFQLYSRLVQTNIPHLLPLMVAAISVPGPENVPSHLKPQFIELKGAQVKTVSFLTYLLKSCAEYIRPHEESICKSIVNLLVTCSDSASIRKELLVSLKHVLGTDFKRGLFPLIDTLLDERVLVGTGRACFESLRPLAYSLLAEIVHHVRGDLSLSQLSRIIYLFSRNMHDSTLSVSIHTTCARLMLNLVEPIFEKGVDQQSMDEARILLGRILDAFVGKFSNFKRTIPQLLEEGEVGKDRVTLRAKLELPVQAVMNLQVPVEHSKEVNDYKNLIKTLVMGMKTIIWSITHAHLARPQGLNPQALASQPSAPQGFKGMREDEVWKASGVLKSGVHCLALFKEKDEEKEMLSLFSQILAIMEPRDLMDMFSLCMPELFECMINNNQLVQIFAALLQAPKVYKPFADVLINLLVSSKLDVLKNPESDATKLVLHLFRCIFGAVTKAPSDFERILQHHVPAIMEVCMKNATEVEKPLGYMQLLRTVFRGLAGCKYELLLRDLIPMLLPCLNMLLTMLEGPAGEDMKDLLLELCLTLPARLSSLLPYLPRLMKPLVFCLRGSDELVSLGLRTLEFWVDSLNPDFLEPSMANVMSEVILALWSHLRPVPYPWGGKALQILGKLGGRNRRFLKEPLTLECKDNPEHGLRLVLTFEPSTPFLVPLDKFINLAVVAVIQKNQGIDIYYRKQALKFLRVCLLSQLNLPGCVTDVGQTPRQLSTLLRSAVDSSLHRSESGEMKADLGVKTKTQLMAEKSIFKTLLVTILAASSDLDLSDSDDDFVVNICRHFAIILHIDYTSSNASSSTGSLGGSVISASSRSKGNRSSNLKQLDPLIFLDALVDVLADENRLHAKAALNALNVFSETLLFLARVKHADVLMARGGHNASMIVSSPSTNPVYSPHPSVRIPVFEQLLPRLLHGCYGSTWQAQMGGVMGLGALVGKVNVETLCLFQVKIVRGLVYVLKRLPVYASKEQEETSQVLMQILRVVNNVDEANSEARRKSFQDVVEYLATELIENYEILLDSLWKLPDWAYLKDHVIPKAQVEETPKLRLVQAYFALHDRNSSGVGDAENIVGKGVDLALEQWWQLPEMSVHARVPLLQQFQQLVEVQESARIHVDIANGNKVSGNAAVGAPGNRYADLKDILETWRLRTPNEWDSMPVWYDMLQWRNEMYNVVIEAFKDFATSNSPLHHLGFRDKAWNVNKLARIARKQELYDVCVQILEKMYGHSTMEVQEAFVKIREQAKAYLEMKGERASGLNLINSTNLEYFPDKIKAEIFRLKGDFHLKLNDTEGANIAYSNAITLFKNLPKGWISWGNYCDMAYQETQDEIWLEYAVSCFLQGIRFGVSNSRSHIARVLYLLSFDTANEPVGRVFDKHLEQVPHWVWLSWIPQLLLSLQRTEAPHCKLVLLKIAAVFPQALYYWLRTYLLERRDAVNKSELGRLVLAQRMQQNASGVAGHGGGNLPSETHQGAQVGGASGTHDSGNPHGQESERSTAENNAHPGNDQSMHQSSSTINENTARQNGASLAIRPLGMPIPPVGGIATLNSAELKDKVNSNVKDVIGRIRGIAPQYFSEEDENIVEPPQSVQRGVNELVEAALSPRNLCMMDPTWHPWF